MYRMKNSSSHMNRKGFVFYTKSGDVETNTGRTLGKRSQDGKEVLVKGSRLLFRNRQKSDPPTVSDDETHR